MAKRKTLKRGTKKVRTVIQAYDDYCGPATAKMVLQWLGVRRSQDALWDAIQDKADVLNLPACEPCLGLCVEWSTRPEPLAGVVKEQSNADIKLISESTAAATDHTIVWSVLNEVPAIALVMGATHWVVVHGYSISRAPANINDTSYELLGFDMIDPYRRQGAREFVPAARWRADYMTGVECGRFDGKFVAVCDPEPRTTQGGPTVRRTAMKRELKGGVLRTERLSKLAFDGIKRAGLMDHDTWKRAMVGVDVGQHHLVHRLDRPQNFYTIVPFEKAKRVQAQVMLDPYDGTMLGASAAEDVRQSLTMPCTPEEAIDRVAEKRFDLPGARPRMRLKREGLSASSTQVWKPCKESLSPYLPFTRVTYGEHTLYVRADGKVFTALTPAKRGS